MVVSSCRSVALAGVPAHMRIINHARGAQVAELWPTRLLAARRRRNAEVALRHAQRRVDERLGALAVLDAQRAEVDHGGEEVDQRRVNAGALLPAATSKHRAARCSPGACPSEGRSRVAFLMRQRRRWCTGDVAIASMSSSSSTVPSRRISGALAYSSSCCARLAMDRTCARARAATRGHSRGQASRPRWTQSSGGELRACLPLAAQLALHERVLQECLERGGRLVEVVPSRHRVRCGPRHGGVREAGERAAVAGGTAMRLRLAYACCGGRREGACTPR
jgi:hypothetical protein